MLKEIHMERAEGPIYDLGKFSCKSFKDAHKRIRLWARTAPEGGGYDKTDVALVFDGLEEGEETTIRFRFDMTRDHATAACPLWDEALTYCRFYSGKFRPHHINEATYARLMAAMGDANVHELFGKAAEMIAEAA